MFSTTAAQANVTSLLLRRRQVAINWLQTGYKHPGLFVYFIIHRRALASLTDLTLSQWGSDTCWRLISRLRSHIVVSYLEGEYNELKVSNILIDKEVKKRSFLQLCVSEA